MSNQGKWKVSWKARKKKRLFERVDIFPYPFVLKNETYFLIHFSKFRRLTGVTVLSAQEDSENEGIAFALLFKFHRLYNSILVDGKMRVQIKHSLFQGPLEIMGEEVEGILKEGYSFIEEILSQQKLYYQTYTSFFTHIRNKHERYESFTEEEVTRAFETAAKLERIQHELLIHLSEHVELISKWIEEMKEANLWNQLEREQRVFYEQLIVNEDMMKEEAKKVQHDRTNRTNQDDLEELKQKLEGELEKEKELLR